MHPPLMHGGPAARWREILSDLLSAPVTLLAAALLLGVQAVLAGFGGVEKIPEVYQMLGLSREGIAQGEVWQPLSYGLLHGGWAHLLINLFCLLAFGSRIELIGGGALVLKILAGGILAGGAFHLLLGGAGAGAPCLVGASGGVIALLIWLTGVSPGSQMWPLRVSGKSLGWGMLMASGMLTVMNPILDIPRISDWGRVVDEMMKGALFQVSHACHFGGALAGWSAARWELRPRVTLAQLQKERARRESSCGSKKDEVNERC